MAKIVMTMLELEKMIQLHLGMTGMKISEVEGVQIVEFDFPPAVVVYMKPASDKQKALEIEASWKFTRGTMTVDMKTPAMNILLENFRQTGEFRKIDLIKEVRAQTGEGIYESKQFVDIHCEDLGSEYKKFKLLEEIRTMGGN